MSISVSRTAILGELPSEEAVGGLNKNLPAIPRLRSSAVTPPAGGKILLQPRICTLRSYGSGAIRSPASNSRINLAEPYLPLRRTPGIFMSISVARTAILGELPSEEAVSGRNKNLPEIPRLRSSAVTPPAGGKILLQPRICTLRSYGSGAIQSPASNSGANPSLFFSSLADYVDSARKSHDFEILSGRVAMIAFSAALGVEFVTGNALFKKLELKEIAGAAGVCLAVVSSAAVFARLSSARAGIGQMLTLSCNSFVDSIVDNIIDGLFYENQLSDWSDEI